MTANVVPLGYSHLRFIRSFVAVFGNELSRETTTGVAAMAAEGFAEFANKTVTEKDGDLLTHTSKYRHVHKLIFYSEPDKKPQM